MHTMSIIVPVYNAERYLNRCIASILSQSRTDFELILVDDGSADSSGAICDAFAAQYSNIIAVHQVNRGVSAARNMGIAHASGKYIAFVDSDDWIDADMYDMFLHKMEADKAVDICVGGMVRNSSDGTEVAICPHRDACIFSRDEAVEELFRWDYFRWELCGKIYRRKLFDNFQMDEKIRLGEDLDANWELFHRAQCVFYSSDHQYHYFENEESATHLYKSYMLDDSLELLFGKIMASQFEKSAYISNKMHSIYYSHLVKKIIILLFLDSEKHLEECKNYQKKIRETQPYASSLAQSRSWIIDEDMEDIKQTISQKCNLFTKKFENALRSYANIYIYGTGTVSEYVNVLMQKIGMQCSAYVVSDNQRKRTSYNGCPVLYLSTIPVDNSKNYFWLAVNRKHMDEICSLLLSIGHTNFEHIDLDIFGNLK